MMPLTELLLHDLSKRLPRRVRVDTSLAQKTGNMATSKLFLVKTAVATILILEDWLKKVASITRPLTFLNVS